MLSSTSSSKRRSALAILLGGVLLIALYLLAVALLRPNIRMAQNQAAWNEVVMQRYLYEVKPEQAVLVGSSMSFRLLQPLLGNSVFNLGQAGGSPLTGLALIAEREREAAGHGLIMIETNVLQRPADLQPISNALDQPMRAVRRWLPGVRSEYAPVNWLINIGMDIVEQHTGRNLLLADGIDERVLANSLAVQTQAMASLPDARQLAANIAALQDLATRLDGRQRFVLVELPMHPLLQVSAQQLALRQALLTAFPPDQYRWLRFANDTGRYPTSDGIHLNFSGARQVAAQLRQYAEQPAPVGRALILQAP